MTADLTHTVHHPVQAWQVANGEEVITLTAGHINGMPPAETLPRSGDDRRVLHHPQPNGFTLRIHEGDPQCVEAQTVLDQSQARALQMALNQALNWDGQ